MQDMLSGNYRLWAWSQATHRRTSVFGLFQKNPTIDADDEQWQLQTWHWLLENFGGIRNLRNHKTLCPSNEDFSRSETQGLEHAKFVFKQTASYFDVDPNGFDIILQETDINPMLNPLGVVQNVPQTPLGTYRLEQEQNRHVISINPNNLGDMELLIATIAHEICHPLLFSIPNPPPGAPEAEEFATDLATVFFGFGIFGANTSFRFQQRVDVGSGTQGWSFSGAGYLRINEWGYALAVRQMLTGEDENRWLIHMNEGVKIHYQKNLKYLRTKPELLENLMN